MPIKDIFNKILGKKTVVKQDKEPQEPEPIKFHDSASIAAQARTFSNRKLTTPNDTKLTIQIPEGQFKLYDAIKIKVQKQAETIVDPEMLDIVAVIKERQEALHNLVNFLKSSVGFPPGEPLNRVYILLTPLIESGENAGKINRNMRYGIFKDLQQELITYFDASDHLKAHLVNDSKENQRLLILIGWIIALKNFALNKPVEYAKLIDDLAATQQTKLAAVLVFLAESNFTDAILAYTGTIRSAEFKVLIENAIRQWYQGCNLVCL